jgi:heavy metal efflux system protein
MLQKIIEFSVKNKLIILLFTLALIGYGSYQVTQLSIDAVPDITDNQVQIITVAPALGATDIERLVTFPVEQANSNIAGIKQLRSFSRFGLSLVTIVFEDDVDLYWARQQVSERLNQVKSQIPQGVGEPELGPISTGLGEIYQYVVRPEKGYENKYSLAELRTIQDWVIRQNLLGVKGVAEVSSFGGDLKQIEIAVDPNQLNAHRVTIEEVFEAINTNNENTGGAYIEKGPTTLYIRSEGLVKSLHDIEQIVIKSNANGLPLHIKDIAKVQEGKAVRYGALAYNGEQEVAGAVVLMLKGENSSKIVKNVKARIEDIKKMLPEGVVIEPFLDRTKMVNNSIHTVESNLLEGALIVLLVLVFFLGNMRAGLLVASVIPLAMLFAISMMNLFGVSGNLMSLGALDFGLIIDGAVIIVESVLHHLTSKKLFKNGNSLSQSAMDEEVIDSSSTMMNSAVFGQIIILIVYLPIFSLQGIEGKMFVPMAQTVAFALLGAFILSLTYVPMMSSIVLSKKFKSTKNFSDRIMDRVEKQYTTLLKTVFRNGKKVIVVISLLFVFGLIVASQLGGVFIPTLEEGDFAVETRVLTGSNLPTTVAYSNKAAKILKDQFPEVNSVVTKIGSAEVPTDPMPMDAGDMIINLKDKSEWTSAKTFNELADKMSEAIAVVPGITTSFQYPVQMRFNELMTGARQDIVVKIFGENLDSLANTANKLGEIINSVDGATNLYVEAITGLPQVVINYKRDQIAKYNLTIAQINRVVNTAFAGQAAGLYYEGERRFDMVVRLEEQKKTSLSDIKQLLISTPSGNQIPLSEVAEIQIIMGPNQIQRENAKRRIIVGFNVKNKDTKTVVNDLQAKVEAQLKLPNGYYITYGGSYENLNQAVDRLAIVVPIALGMIFLLLFFAFKSVKESILIYTAIPLSTIGGILLLAARGLPFSISAGVGFIALFGIAVLNGIVLISEFNNLKKSGLTHPLKIIFKGTTTRLRPVLMTAFVASFGFIPMALSNGSGAEVQRPLATVVIGGLFSATFLTLFLLPLLFYSMEIRNQKKIRKNGNNGTTKMLLFVLFFGITSSITAQEPVSLDQAKQKLEQVNLNLAYREILIKQAQLAEKSSFSLDATTFNAGFGQINGAYADNSFGVAQTFQFPTVYSKKKKFLQQQTLLATAQKQNLKAELTKQLELLFYGYEVTEKQKTLLLYCDSIYAQAVTRQENRLKLGDINSVELGIFQQQRFSIYNQVKQIEIDQYQTQLSLQILLNQPQPVSPQLPLDELYAKDTETDLKEHPLLKVKEAQLAVGEAKIKNEKSRLLPSLTVEYANNSFKGTGPDDVSYSRDFRFHSVNAGINIPLFTKAKNDVSVLKFEQQANQQEYLIEQQSLEQAINQLQNQIQQQTQLITYYQNNMLAASVIFERIADQFKHGELNYIEFVTLVNQNIDQQNNFLQIVRNYNTAVILYNYYLVN